MPDSDGNQLYTETNYQNCLLDHSNEIAGHISQLFNNKDYSDINLIIKTTEFPAHRVILASRSDYFRALLYGGLSETHTSTIVLTGINETAFYNILGYIYTGKLSIIGLKIEDVLDILGLACQYNFQNLQNALSMHFRRSLQISNVFPIYDIAVTYDLEDLIIACLEFIDRTPSAMLVLPQFLQLSRASVVRILNRDSFYAPEMEILHGVERWLEAKSVGQTQISVPEDSDDAVSIASLPVTTSNTAAKLGRLLVRSNSSESLFRSSDSAAKQPSQDKGVLETVSDDMCRHEVIQCIRFELMSLTELSTEVRAARLLSSDALLDAIGAKTQKKNDQLHIRGRLLPEVNLAVARLGCSLVAGHCGNYPFFFVDDGQQKDKGLQTKGFVKERSNALPISQTLPLSRPSKQNASGSRVTGDASAAWAAAQPPITSVSSVDSGIQPPIPSFTARPFQRDLLPSSSSPLVAAEAGGGSMATGGVGGDNNQHLKSWLLHHQQGGEASLPVHNQHHPYSSAARSVERGNPSYRYGDGGSAGFDADTERSHKHHHNLRHTQYQHIQNAHPHDALPVSVHALETELAHPVHSSSGVTARSGGQTRTPSVPPPESEHSVVSHLIGIRGGEIVIDLGHNSMVNMISMQLWDREPRSYSYFVEVSLSMDGVWHRVVDYSDHVCRSWQTLYFPSRFLRYIRVVGAWCSVGQYFHLVTFRCLYTREKFMIEHDLIVPRNNVATVQLGATVLEGVSRHRNSLIDGDVLVYNLSYGFTCHQLGSGCIVVQLSQPFLVSSMRFLLWDLDCRAYSYVVDVSQDRQAWRTVCDASQLQCRSWQTVKFPQQTVTFIRVTGTGNTVNNVFHLVHLECPASTLDPEAVASGNADEVYEMPSLEASAHQILTPLPQSSPPEIFNAFSFSNSSSALSVDDSFNQLLHTGVAPSAGGEDRRPISDHSPYSSLHRLPAVASWRTSAHFQSKEESSADVATTSSGSINSENSVNNR